ncbi:PfkB family carbohydrate kinase [Aureimonas sp. SK2]|uniref:PfkB family carbohydrate kinase n=1 Tax=Aureimonas sp. SK2 TaxID=3015992 RepID=UPI00244471FD|nr:PfkB family carbohydrate kinase [Aureimonas sp. SK2]
MAGGADFPHVVLVGAAHLDRIAVSDAAFQPGCSNPGRVIERLGGASFNAALALRAFGARTHLVSACGGDAVAERIGVELDLAGIADARISWLDRRSATYTALVDASGDLVGGVADMAIYERLVPRVLSRRHLKDLFGSADGLLVDANLPADALEHLASCEPGKPVAAIAVSPAKAARLRGALPDLSILFASRAEAARLFDLEGDATDVAIVNAIAETGLPRAVITDGPRPVLVIADGKALRQAPPPVDSIADVVGAGDTLAGTAFHATLSGRPLVDAVRTGLVAASLRITTGLTEASAARAPSLADALPAPQPITA